MTEYSPFDKDLEDLDEQDLQKLIDNSISEGWYVEFKADIPKKTSKIDGAKIVKSISAFANTKGGWLFYGVQANDKNIATNLCGLDFNEYKNIADQVSQIISSNIAPKPIYHFKIVPIQSGNFVFVIKIEESPTPPYITSQGVIYQRENSESNPIKDRYIIEKLTEKTNEYYESIERFCNIDYGETKGQSESNQSYLELYLFPLPFNDFHFEKFFSTDFFRQVAIKFYQSVECVFESQSGEKKNIPLNLGFNSIYSSQNSLIVRPIKNENIIYKTTTAELFINGGLKFLIPLYEFDLSCVPKHYKDSPVIDYLRDKYSPNETVKKLNLRYSYEDEPAEITRRKETDFTRHIKMIDGAEFIYVLLIIISKYRAILEDSKFDLNSEIAYRARVTNTWRKFVFFDNSDYLEKIKLFNLPIVPKTELEVPRFIKGNYYKLDVGEQASFFSIARTILDAIGLPDASTIKFADIITDGLKKYNI
jgi:hypothetical protein